MKKYVMSIFALILVLFLTGCGSSNSNLGLKDDKDKTTKYGVIAQEVEAVGLGNLVKDNGETKSVDYISLLILKIEALEKRSAELEAERR